MRVLLFVTAVRGVVPVDPMLVLPDHPDAALPPHPNGLEWQYFATTSLDDQLLIDVRSAAEQALGDHGYFVWGAAPGGTEEGATRLSLAVKNALLIEDDYLLAAVLQTSLEEMGVQRVTSVASVEAALRILEAESWELAVLDVLLNGEPSYAIADLLLQRGTPFFFCTVVQELPKPYREVPVLSKPFRAEQLERILQSALRR